MLKRIKKYHSHFIYRMKMRKKLLISYFILILLPLVIVYFVLFSKISNIIEYNAKFSSAHSFEQAYSYLSYKIHKIKKASDFVVYNSTVRDILEHSSIKQPLTKQLADYNTLSVFLSSIEEDQEIKKTHLYVPDGLISAGENANIFSFSSASNTSWYKKFVSKTYSIIFFPSYHFNKASDPEQVLSVVRFFNSTENFSRHLGILRLDFSRESIEKIISNANAVNGSITFLQNEAGELIASSDNAKVKLYSKYNATFQALATKTYFSEISLGDEMTLTRVIDIPETDWHMVTIVPKSTITKEAENYRNYMLLLVFSIGIIAYILAYSISSVITKRISLLQKKMKKFQDGDFNAYMPTIGDDEISSLSESYNFMIEKIAGLVDEQRLSAIKLKNSELKALQAQINPHFLYNSFEMINCFAYQNKPEEVNKIIQELARFYKLSLNKGDDMISLSDEIQHVSAYVNIQNLRFQDKITLKLDIDQQLMKYKIPKIILQPIIENSILHGILEKESKSGTIEIVGAVHVQEDEILLSIQDDGVGMSAEVIASLNSINSAATYGGNYGLRNVSERIKLFYGEKYGLSYESRLGIGTIVTIRLPLKDA